MRLIPLPFILFIFACLPAAENLEGPASLDSLPQYRLSEIVVLGERIPETGAVPVYDIPADYIQKLDSHHPQEALNYVPGLYFSRSSKNEYTFRMRGFEQRQVNVFLDGVPVSLPFDGILDLSQLTGDNLANIRLSRGTSSVLYGANTLGGNINIITAFPGRERRWRLRTEANDHGRIFGNALLASYWKKLRFIAGFSLDNAPNFQLPANTDSMRNEGGGERDNSDYRKSSALLKLNYQVHPSHRLGINLHVIENRFNIPPNALMQTPRYWQFPQWQKKVLNLSSEHAIHQKFILRSVWFLDKYENVLKSYDDATYSTQKLRYAFTSIYDDYNLGAVLYPQFFLTSRGASNGILSYKKDVHREKSGETAPFQEYAIETFTAGLEQEIQFQDNWTGQAGVDMNYLRPLYAQGASLRDPILLANVQLTLRHTIRQRWQIYAAVGNKSRFPTLKELYSERLGRNIANPSLQAERALNGEIGIGLEEKSTYLEMNIFRNLLKDHVVNVAVGQGVQQYQNMGKAVYQGLEIGFRQKWPRGEINLNYTYLSAQNHTPGRNSDFLEYRPAHRVNGVLYFTPVDRFFLHFEGTYTADQHYQDPDNLNWMALNDFMVINLKFEYLFSPLISCYLRVNNLSDLFYYSEYGVPMPGRELLLGLKIGG